MFFSLIAMRKVSARFNEAGAVEILPDMITSNDVFYSLAHPRLANK